MVNDEPVVGNVDGQVVGFEPDKQTTGNEPEHNVDDDACEYDTPLLVDTPQKNDAC